MGVEVHIHEAQISILRELLFQPEAGYTELQKPTGLASDHFNFHIKRLMDLGLVERSKRGRYHLSSKGKEYANKLDTDNNTIERQPKVAVLLATTMVVDGQTLYLFQERLKQPYFGYWGFPGGKIRWGETVLEAAARELLEETGLQAKHKFMGIYHEHTYQEETGEMLEDKIFFVVKCFALQGMLIEQFEGGRNAWMLREEVEVLDKKFASFETEMAVAEAQTTFIEELHRYKKTEF